MASQLNPVPQSAGEATVIGVGQAGAVDSAASRKLNWHDVEPILKWGTVAYAFGFLTIMLYTNRLGIPVLQLIEPVNVWIGAPLAVAAFFFDKLYAVMKRNTADLFLRIRKARDVRNRLNSKPDSEITDLFRHVIDLLVDSLTLLTADLDLFGVSRKLIQALIPVYLKRTPWAYLYDPTPGQAASAPALSQRDRTLLLNFIGRILQWAGVTGAILRFLNFAGAICLVPLACFLYVYLVFPLVPQTLGGGRPMTVQLLISADALPKVSEFRDWLPATGKKEPSASEAPAQAPSKEPVLVPVTLYFRTDHELYVQKKPGPVVSLSDHAVEGIIFSGR